MLTDDFLRGALRDAVSGRQYVPPLEDLHVRGKRDWRRRTLVRFAVAAPVVAGLAIFVIGGSTGDSDKQLAQEPNKSDGGVTLVVANSSNASELLSLAEVIGILGRDARGCVTIENGDGARRVAMWESGISTQGSPEGFILFSPEGRALAKEGDLISVSGGFGTVNGATEDDFLGCAMSGDTVVYVGSDVTVR